MMLYYCPIYYVSFICYLIAMPFYYMQSNFKHLKINIVNVYSCLVIKYETNILNTGMRDNSHLLKKLLPKQDCENIKNICNFIRAKEHQFAFCLLLFTECFPFLVEPRV